MKYLFCGLGSIAERHISNLLSLGETDIIAFRRNDSPLKTIKKKIKTFTNFNEVLAHKPDVAFITTPSAFHIPLAIQLAMNNCHLFIEKPLSTSLVNIDQLVKIVKKKKLVIQIGFMMRYHPAIRQIKEWLKQNIIGEPIFARVCWGEYLPAWHPWEDYRKSYAANKNLGGGPIFTLCHDIDLMSYFFGEPKSVYALANKKSSLDISTEHCTEILFEYKNKLIVEIHLDFLQLPPKRTWEIVGNNGRIEFNYYKNLLELYVIDSNKLTFKKTTIDFSTKFERNDMFLKELKNFIDYVKVKKIPEITLEDGINNIKLLTAIHKSINTKKVVNITKE